MSIWSDERAAAIALYEVPVRLVGLGDTWDELVARGTDATSTLALSSFGAVAMHIYERGLRVIPRSP